LSQEIATEKSIMNDSQEPKTYDEWHQKYLDGVYGSDKEIGEVPETFEEYAETYNLRETRLDNDSAERHNQKNTVEDPFDMQNSCSFFDSHIDDSLQSSSSSSDDESDGADGTFEEPSRYFQW
jgi:hypothetical protein